jgi:hypothetical protein
MSEARFNLTVTQVPRHAGECTKGAQIKGRLGRPMNCINHFMQHHDNICEAVCIGWTDSAWTRLCIQLEVGGPRHAEVLEPRSFLESYNLGADPDRSPLLGASRSRDPWE